MVNIKTIGYNMFSRCGELTKAHFPDVTKIEHSAFKYCSSLKTLRLGSGTPPLVEAGEPTQPFESCPKVRSLELVDEVAKEAYDSDTRDDGQTDNGLWYGWSVRVSNALTGTHTQEKFDRAFGSGNAALDASVTPNVIKIIQDITVAPHCD